MWGKGIELLARVFIQWWNFGTSQSPCHPSCQDQVAALCQLDLQSWHFHVTSFLCGSLVLCTFSLVICPLVLLVLNAKSHWFWRQDLQPIIIWVYCYSAMSSISPSRNIVRHSGLISYCTAINDSMWRRAQGLKICLLQRLGFHSHLTPALLQMTRIRTREVGMKCLIINIRPPERMKASGFNKRTVFLNSTIRL